MTEAVVARALFRIAEHRIRFRGGLEALFSRGVAVIAVRMMFQRQLAVGALDVRFTRVPGDSESLVVILTTHALATFTRAGRMRRDPIRYPRRISSTISPSRRSRAGSLASASCHDGSKSSPRT